MGEMANYYGFDYDFDACEELDCTTWCTRDGRTINIKDMEDAHLANAIKFLSVRGVHDGYVRVYKNMLKEQKNRAHNSKTAKSAEVTKAKIGLKGEEK